MNEFPEAKFRKLIERREVATLWTQKYTITPRLVATIFGDGGQVIGLAPIDYRPNYFVVRIDSRWNTNNKAQDCELLVEHIDEIYDEIEDEFTFWPWAKMYGLKRNRERGEDESAYIDFSCGSAWWEISWVDLLAKALDGKPKSKV